MIVSCTSDCFEKHDYDQGIFQCCGDMKACCWATLLPVSSALCAPCVGGIGIGRYLGKVEGTKFNLVGCCCPILGIYRLRRLMVEKQINQESKDGSILASTLCCCCALSQDIHEARKFLKEDGATQSEPPAPALPPTKE